MRFSADIFSAGMTDSLCPTSLVTSIILRRSNSASSSLISPSTTFFESAFATSANASPMLTGCMRWSEALSQPGSFAKYLTYAEESTMAIAIFPYLRGGEPFLGRLHSFPYDVVHLFDGPFASHLPRQ